MQKAQLILEDGTVFNGFSFGHKAGRDGEVVFNTGMVGYPESLTDPSYKGQILVFTYPLVGNYGVPGDKQENGIPAFFESARIHLSGIIVSEYSENYSHWRAEKSLARFLMEQEIPAITGIDTRALTKKLREKGVMLGRILIGEEINEFSGKLKVEDPNLRNLVGEVCVKTPEVYRGSSEASSVAADKKNAKKKKIICIDCGMKNNILRSFLKYALEIKRVPADYDFKKEEYDGIFVSNGPGDPAMNKTLIENISWALQQEKPVFGICLGNQILGLAAGAKTYKLKYGHRSQNQPCYELGTDRCYLTSQNHGFAVDEKTLPTGWEVWFKNANDGTVEGIKHKSDKFFAVQFHPEAYPGPEDTGWLFEKFIGKL